ncbi:hypothetical protein HNQ44_001116 [Planomicrobium koreense]|uniref:Uncharacterized protein n=1 Tax=Planococcus koreensis TaxID=112331 RepID=A0A7W8FUD7_9BACL|nr:hypothetical protein [Planococcus koreensis]
MLRSPYLKKKFYSSIGALRHKGLPEMKTVPKKAENLIYIDNLNQFVMMNSIKDSNNYFDGDKQTAEESQES